MAVTVTGSIDPKQLAKDLAPVVLKLILASREEGGEK